MTDDKQVAKRDYMLRCAGVSDLPALQEIWGEVFGKEGMGAFFGCLFAPERTVVAELSGSLEAMGHIVPAGELCYPGSGQPPLTFSCAMLYAIATTPGYRGRGLGAALSRELVKKAYDMGFDVIVTCPSEEGLFDFYSKHTDLREFFYSGIKHFSANSAHPYEGKAGTTAGGGPVMEKLSINRYTALRESLLICTTHICMNDDCLEFQRLLCDELGGGLYRIGDSCAVIEVQQDGLVCARELVVAEGDNVNDVCAVMSSHFPSNAYQYRLPAKEGEGAGFAMLATKEPLPEMPRGNYAPWYGPAFD